ncbi:MAG: M1 family metallopeptidase, partial [Bacteroidota bacterium]
YLDQGEFYSEFGNFTVTLTLPENYLVGATGTLREASERQWLRSKAAENRAELEQRVDLSEGYVAEEFPASSEQTKTISWTAEQVHDFAWFADKRFMVLHDTLQFGANLLTSSGGAAGAVNGIEEPGTVDVWAFFTETEAALWKYATDYLKRATRFYSDHVGRYPYPQVTGIQSALSAGGGMEYPMITVIGRNSDAADLDEVLTHEVGHNWFYGILASNERDHPWMDEGLNSYYEQRYMAKYYPDRKLTLPFVGEVDYDRLGYLNTARLGQDQAPDTRSDSLSNMNYWIGAYSKPSLALQELEGFIGKDSLDWAMKTYYQTWKFRHPQPGGFFAVMEAAITRQLSPWFAEGFLTDKTSDWKQGAAPGFLYFHRGDRRPPSPAEQLTAQASGLDLYPRNNNFLQPKLKLSFGTAQEQPDLNNFFYFPLAGYNVNDGIQLGAALHNRTLEPRKLEWALAPMFGFGSSTLTGFAGAQYRMPRPFASAQQLVVGLGTQRFSDFTLGRTDEAYAYQRTALRATLSLDHPPITERESELTLQLIQLAQNRPEFSGDTLPSG